MSRHTPLLLCFLCLIVLVNALMAAPRIHVKDSGVFPYQKPNSPNAVYSLSNVSQTCDNLWLQNNVQLFRDDSFGAGGPLETEVYTANSATTLQAVSAKISLNAYDIPEPAAVGVILVRVGQSQTFDADAYQQGLIGSGSPLHVPQSDVIWAETRAVGVNGQQLDFHYHSACDPSIENIQLSTGDRLVLVVGGYPHDSIVPANSPEAVVHGSFNYQYQFP